MTHELILDENDTNEGRPDEANHARRIVGIAQRRAAPPFFICDPFMNVLSASPELDPALNSREALALLAPICHESRTSKTTIVHFYNVETVLRIVPLSAALSGCVALFVDSFARRGSIFEAAKTFGLTKRELHVLQLLVSGKANAEIAAALYVAESTVGDHLKSVMRKMDVSTRGELIAKVFNLEHDLPGELD